ncbi:MAG: tetratricopeptide repeat protein [Ignavibacteria bacterium]|jgi:tetratricopeptide (TPR) repeat protein
MKFIPLLIVFGVSLVASPIKGVNTETAVDSINLMQEFSLFYEYHKNDDFASAEPHGWNILHSDPVKFIKYRPYKKMEDILWYLHDSSDVTDERKQVIADTILWVYDQAMEKNPEKADYFQIKKAYVSEIWHDFPHERVVSEYEKAIEMNPDLSTFYYDRLGRIYLRNVEEDSDYKIKALELYSKLAQREPENTMWPDMMARVASDPQELEDIYRTTWILDKENLEKAYQYASLCFRNENYDSSIVAFEFLTEKAPEVINYWKQLSTAYDKLGKTEQAINAYKTLIELQPDNRDNYANIAIIYKGLGQLSVARSYLQKAANTDPSWDYPYYIEAQLYEQTARDCYSGKFEFMDKCVYQLAVDTYRKARSKGGSYAGHSGDRINALKTSVPQQEDYFFRKLSSGDVIKIEGRCYDWIGRSITVP